MKKQNVFDDFIAAAEYLIKEKYTSSDYLAIKGGSNGGLLVGAVMTQRPDLVKVALPAVGVLDMLRYHTFTAGAGWAYDYGTSEQSKEPYIFRSFEICLTTVSLPTRLERNRRSILFLRRFEWRRQKKRSLQSYSSTATKGFNTLHRHTSP